MLDEVFAELKKLRASLDTIPRDAFGRGLLCYAVFATNVEASLYHTGRKMDYATGSDVT